MVKKLGIGIAILLILVLGVTSLAMAQGTSSDPEAPVTQGTCPYGGTCPYSGTETCPLCGTGQGPAYQRGGGMRGYGSTKSGATMLSLAESLGMGVTELAEALQNGSTVAQLAGENGISIDSLIEKHVAARVEQLNQAVEDGTLTREQADWLIEDMREHVLKNFEWGMGFSNGVRGRGGIGSGTGNCPMGNGQGTFQGTPQGGMRGRRGNQQQTPAQQNNTP